MSRRIGRLLERALVVATAVLLALAAPRTDALAAAGPPPVAATPAPASSGTANVTGGRRSQAETVPPTPSPTVPPALLPSHTLR